jgi:hypothetical protein
MWGLDYGDEQIGPGISMGDNIVMLSVAKHLFSQRDKPFAEFTLSETNVLRVTKHCRSWSLNCIIGFPWML